MDYIPVSKHNAKAWKLNEVDTSVKLKCPDQEGVLTVCDYSRTAKDLARISMDMDADGFGFTMSREDQKPIQAQYVRPNHAYDAQGLNVFEEPVDDVSLRRSKESGLWYVERDLDEVADAEGLRVLVWAMAKYSLDKQQRATQTPSSAERPLVRA